MLLLIGTMIYPDTRQTDGSSGGRSTPDHDDLPLKARDRETVGQLNARTHGRSHDAAIAFRGGDALVAVLEKVLSPRAIITSS